MSISSASAWSAYAAELDDLGTQLLGRTLAAPSPVTANCDAYVPENAT